MTMALVGPPGRLSLRAAQPSLGQLLGSPPRLSVPELWAGRGDPHAPPDLLTSPREALWPPPRSSGTPFLQVPWGPDSQRHFQVKDLYRTCPRDPSPREGGEEAGLGGGRS